MATGPEMMAMTALKMALPALMKNPEFVAKIEAGLTVIETFDVRMQRLETNIQAILDNSHVAEARAQRVELRSQGYDVEQVTALMRPVGAEEADLFRQYEAEHAG